MKPLTIGLIGNPNSGKSTLFNQLTGLNQRVGNWAGVTVERKSGIFATLRHRVHLVDLPGTYSLTTLSQQAALDEQITCRTVLSGEADLLLNIVDASHLERSLYLTLQLLEMGAPCIVVLNMVDIASAQGITIDVERLSAELSLPVVPLVATCYRELDKLYALIDNYQQPTFPLLQVNYPESIQAQVECLIPYLSPTTPQRAHWLALQLLEGDLSSHDYLDPTAYSTALTELKEAQRAVQQHSGEDAALLIADARYHTIATLCSMTMQRQQTQARFTEHLDRLVLHRWLGIPLFLLLMYSMFFLSINVGGALQPLFDQGSAVLFIQGTQWLGDRLGSPIGLTTLLAQGLGGGINTVMPLVPQIGFMFLFLSLLEESGYMARAAFVMDRLMQALGLPGKSFVPLIVGFGCNVPSIMGTRTLTTERERLLTIMIAPFMACGARLAIFVVFSAAFFGRHGVWVVFSLYLLGIIVAILTGLILKSTLMRGDTTPFVMELPTYHRPHLKSLGIQIWRRLKDFVVRAGKVIILVNLIIGGLNSLSLTGRPVGDNIQASALSTVGRWLTPLLHPIGIVEENWPATVGLITGAIAKEVVIGTLNSLYTAEQLAYEPFDAEGFNLLEALKAAVQQSGQSLKELFRGDSFTDPLLTDPETISSHDPVMSSTTMGVMASKFTTPIAAYSYLIFVLLYIPCVTTIGAIGRESGRGWMWFSVFWGLDVAYSLATLYYQSATFTLHPISSAVMIMSVLIVNTFIFAIMRRMRHSNSFQHLKRARNSDQSRKEGCQGW